MVFPNPRYMRNCIYCGALFFTHISDAPLCPKCFEESREEFMEKGTLFGMRLIGDDSTSHLLSLHLVTNKNGNDATVHVARERNVIRAPESPIKALCGNRLGHVSGVRPLVELNSVSAFETHKDEAPKWCPPCEKRFRKLVGGVRTHNFATAMVTGHPMVYGYEEPTRQKGTTD